MKNINNKNSLVGAIAFIFAVILLLSASNANATRLVYPDDPYWGAHIMSNGEVAITPTNPRNGNGSLQLSTTGDLLDWAFYTRYADDVKRDTWAPISGITESWGLLSEISDLSFDWYRKNILSNNSNLLPYDPFHVQTPALRLLIRDGNIQSELVWERFYTDNQTKILDTWVKEDLMAQNFWRHIFNPESYRTVSGSEVYPFVHQEPLLGITPLSWADIVNDYYTKDAVVYGLSVGVGSYWPANYLGYADTVYLAFNDNDPVIDDNFEFPVPEPSTILLLLSGMAILSVGRMFSGKLCQT